MYFYSIIISDGSEIPDVTATKSSNFPRKDTEVIPWSRNVTTVIGQHRDNTKERSQRLKLLLGPGSGPSTSSDMQVSDAIAPAERSVWGSWTQGAFVFFCPIAGHWLFTNWPEAGTHLGREDTWALYQLFLPLLETCLESSAPGCRPCLVLAVLSIWEVNQWKRACLLSLSPS